MNSFNFEQVRANLLRTQREIPLRLAKQAEKHFAESFSKGRLDEYKWKEVDRRIPGTKTWKYKPKGVSISAHRSNPILVQSGNLRRKVNRSIHTVRPDMIRLVVDLPYADVHNEGGTFNVSAHNRASFFKTTVKSYNGLKLNKKGQYKESFSRRTLHLRGEDIKVSAHSRNIPARPFMKQTKTLTKMQTDLITTYMNKIWRGQ